ncbi:MAG: hypothetical protein AAGJ83_12480 [Planctomycetota bacterium]
MILPSDANKTWFTGSVTHEAVGPSGRWLIALSDGGSCDRFLQVATGVWGSDREATHFLTRDDAAFYAAEIDQTRRWEIRLIYRRTHDRSCGE